MHTFSGERTILTVKKECATAFQKDIPKKTYGRYMGNEGNVSPFAPAVLAAGTAAAASAAAGTAAAASVAVEPVVAASAAAETIAAASAAAETAAAPQPQQGEYAAAAEAMPALAIAAFSADTAAAAEQQPRHKSVHRLSPPFQSDS